MTDKSKTDPNELDLDAPLNGEIMPPTSITNVARGKRGAAPGERRGGRQKGTPNKFNIENQQRSIALVGMTPLDVILERMEYNRRITLEICEARGTKNFSLDEYLKYDAATRGAAAEAAPFCHSRMAPKRPDGDLPTIDLESLTDAQLDILVLRLTAANQTEAD